MNAPYKISPELIARVEQELRAHPELIERPEIAWLVAHDHVRLPPAFLCSGCDNFNDRAPQRYCRACHRAANARRRASSITIPRARYESLLADAMAWRDQIQRWGACEKPLRVIAGGRP